MVRMFPSWVIFVAPLVLKVTDFPFAENCTMECPTKRLPLGLEISLAEGLGLRTVCSTGKAQKVPAGSVSACAAVTAANIPASARAPARASRTSWRESVKRRVRDELDIG